MKIVLRQEYKGIQIEVSEEFDHKKNWQIRNETIKQFLAAKRDIDFLLAQKKVDVASNPSIAYENETWTGLLEEIEKVNKGS